MSATSKLRKELLQERDDLAKKMLEGDAIAAKKAAKLLLEPDLLGQIDAHLTAIGIAGESENKALVYLAMTSRLLPEPVYVLVTGGSAAGKSQLLDKVASLMPEEAKVIATSMSPRAIPRMPPGRLIHCAVIGGERSLQDEMQLAEFTKPLREMHGGKDFTYVVARNRDGDWGTDSIVQLGPIAFLESTTKSRIFPQDANRFLVLQMDDSAEQTGAVISAQTRAAMTFKSQGSVRPVQRQHHALQRQLKRVSVDIPFLRALQTFIPLEPVQMRRCWSMIITLIKCHALLHQRQRKARRRNPDWQRGDPPGRSWMKVMPEDLQHGDIIMATVEDYEAVARLLPGPLGRSLRMGTPRAIDRHAQDLWNWCHDNDSKRFRSGEAKHFLSTHRVAPGTTANLLSRLQKDGYLTKVEESKKGSGGALWEFARKPQPQAIEWLPSGEELRAAMEELDDAKVHQATPR